MTEPDISFSIDTDRDAVRVEFSERKRRRSGVLRIWYTDDQPVRVELTDETGLTPSKLQRFTWSRYLTAADSFQRSLTFRPQVEQADPGPHPGRKGHPRAFYQGVAERYEALRADGVRAPAKRIAEERNYSENTVRTWIKRCRDLGLLPTGRPGRAG